MAGVTRTQAPVARTLTASVGASFVTARWVKGLKL